MCMCMCAVIFPADRELMGKVRRWRKAPNHLGKVASECTAFTPCKTKGQYIPTQPTGPPNPGARRTQTRPNHAAAQAAPKERHTRAHRTRGRAKHRPPVRTNETGRPKDRPETNKRAQGALTHMRGLYRNQQQANKEGPALRTNSNPQNGRNIRIRTKSQHDQHERRQCARKRSQNSTGCRNKVLTESQ